MMKFILDTDILQYFQSGVSRVVEQVSLHQSDGIGITIISFEEQLDGWNAELKKVPKDKPDRLVPIYAKMTQATRFMTQLEIKPFSLDAAILYARLRKEYRRSDAYDLRIAAIVKVNQATLVTNNTEDFKIIEGLSIVNWVK